MEIGPHVYGDQRRGLWIASNANLTDKLKHYLPRLRGAIPNLTDLFYPPEASAAQRKLGVDAGFFCHMYDVARGRTATTFANEAVARFKTQGAGALELNFEGSGIGGDENLATYITTTMQRVRKLAPNVRVRANVVPFKGQFLPTGLINSDPQLFLCVQSYGGNMEWLYAAEDVRDEVIAWGVTPSKVTIMHAVMCSQKPGAPRQVTLPQVRNRAAFYIDDLLLDAGLLP